MLLLCSYFVGLRYNSLRARGAMQVRFPVHRASGNDRISTCPSSNILPFWFPPVCYLLLFHAMLVVALLVVSFYFCLANGAHVTRI